MIESMATQRGIGRAFSVHAIGNRAKHDGFHKPGPYWASGSPYNYGVGEPNYPVPAIITRVEIEEDAVCVLERGPNTADGFIVNPNYFIYSEYDEYA